MSPKLNILIKAASAILMIAALIFLTSANFWAYGFKKDKKAMTIVGSCEEEPGSQRSAPAPVEEKTSNGLQNLSEYLHDYLHPVTYPILLSSFGNRHDIINYPIHHPELITPPPKTIA